MGFWVNLLNRVSGGRLGIRHRSGGEQLRERNYWKSNSIYLDNIYNKISTDVAMMKFKHLKVTKTNGKADQWVEYEHSDLMEVLMVSPNEMDAPIVFWSNVVRKMLQEHIAVVIPVSKGGIIQSLELAQSVTDISDGKVTFIQGNREVSIPVGNVWVFENPKQNVSSQLGQISRLIDENLRALSTKLADDNKILKGFLKLPTKTADGELKKMADSRVEDIMDSAGKAGIGYLQQGEDFLELKNTYTTASKDEMEFLKLQLYQAFGINEKLFTCDYNEDQYRAYYQSVVKVYIRLISEEINRKYLTKTARTQGQRVMVYMDLYDITSLKDLNEMAFKQKYSGNMNSNEIRTEVLGLPPYDGGDVYETNKNAVQVGSTGNEDVAKMIEDAVRKALKGGD